MNKQYIGDGVYVEKEGINYILTTEDGVSITNRIVLEPSIANSMLTFMLRS